MVIVNHKPKKAAKVYSEDFDVFDEVSGSRFIKVNMNLIKNLKGDCNTTVLLYYIINTLAFRKMSREGREKLIKDGMWFVCPTGKVWEDLGMDRYQQTALIKKLEQLGVLLTEYRKNRFKWTKSPIKWLKFNIEKLKEISRN